LSISDLLHFQRLLVEHKEWKMTSVIYGEVRAKLQAHLNLTSGYFTWRTLTH